MLVIHMNINVSKNVWIPWPKLGIWLFLFQFNCYCIVHNKEEIRTQWKEVENNFVEPVVSLQNYGNLNENKQKFQKV